ncbi:ADP-ribose glycohydrolase MACROD2 isoform X1 [Thunnus albacares]|uniref:ADP-ribose glycohydrolase MACROD2 isoform X1 n=1 Tax=Thunnus maccoyii TaxID=8240 RepID=UPI001C4D6449|nr:ADP-ribose glycohydrolase MACROD2 isoform X1 [Thunnus maccoyii]XP_044228307.1 ADP-ribose glycohydrolase MACROD2 isoform X1 [Thunnus albacares]
MSKKKKDWKIEKERLLRLDREERRKEYRRQEFVCLEKILTWREENKSNDKEEGKELTGGGGLSDKVSLYKGDITVLEVDAIVNAANSSLLGGGGVDGCIHKAAGSCLYDECHSLNGCETGKAKITCGYDLPARYVIHTVGPVARGHVGPTETNDLTSCYQNSLRLMKEHGLSTVAFPCISTGIYGFPNEPAAEIALNTVKNWIEDNPDKITRVIFCVFLETDFAIYKKKMSVIFQDNDLEGTEEQQKGDTTPPSTKSTTKEESEDSNRGKEETGDEEEGDNDAVGNEDVEMESQNQDDDSGHEEPNQEKDKDENENRDKDEDIGMDNNKDEDKGVEKDNDEDKAEEEQPAAKIEEDDTGKSTVEMEDVSEIDKTGTSNGEEIKDHVEISEEPDSVLTDSIQSKDTVEKKE